MTDAQLVRRMQTGDRAAADALIERYYAAILRYCARHAPDAATAEDLTQEVFLRLCSRLDTYQETGQFRAYLYRIAYNLCVDAARRPVPVPLPDTLPDAADPFACVESADEAARLLSRLPPSQREVLLLRCGEGLRFREIAAITGLPLRTVQSRVRAALKTLREVLP